MSVQPRLTSPERHHQPAADADAPPRRSAVRTIVGSLFAGASTALVLTLAVFAGGSEAIITGAALLGFGLGWALLATLTVRRTREPQRWAFVPAAAMSATGIALIAWAPGNETMTRLNWVWPPLLLALTVWMFPRMRRSVTGRGRWVLTAVISVLALTSIGASYDNLVRAGNGADYAAPGTLYDVGNHRLHLDCHGQGSPTVVLFNGLGEVSASWTRIAGPVAATTRVCAYDRAGQGWSDDVASPLDGVESAADLHTLLAAADEQGSYVLVGHSTGGTYAMTYAARYFEQVAGLVLLDSSSPEQFTQVPAYPSQYALMRRGLALLPTLRRVGLGQLLPPTPHLPSSAAETVTALTSTAQAARNMRDEVAVIPEVFTQAQALETLGDRPLAVLTASDNVETTEGWGGAQDELAALSTNRIHRTVDSTHAGLVEDGHPAAEAVRAITEVISSARTDTPLGGN